MARLALQALLALPVVKTDAFLCLVLPAGTNDPAVCSALDLCNTTKRVVGGVTQVKGAAHGRVGGVGGRSQTQEGVGLHHEQGHHGQQCKAGHACARARMGTEKREN